MSITVDNEENEKLRQKQKQFIWWQRR